MIFFIVFRTGGACPSPGGDDSYPDNDSDAGSPAKRPRRNLRRRSRRTLSPVNSNPSEVEDNDSDPEFKLSPNSSPQRKRIKSKNKPLNPATSSKIPTLPCPKCPRKFFDNRGLSKHLIKLHKTPMEYPCQICNHISRSALERMSHQSKFHRMRPYASPRVSRRRQVDSASSEPDPTPKTRTIPCPKCSCMFFLHSGLARHLTIKHNIKSPPTYSCPDCGLLCKNLLDRLNHRANVHGIAQGKIKPAITECYSCKISFPSRNEYLSHLRALHPDQLDKQQRQTKWHCPLCLKPFKTGQRYNNHLTFHQTDTGLLCLHYCSCCAKSFESEELLLEHLSSEHQGAYNCWTCHASYTNGPLLKRHLETQHEKADEKNFQCNFCSKAFTNKQYWTIHR